MAINKNFVVKNGIEVNENLIIADPDQNKVGIATTVLSQTLTVKGGIGATDITITGIATISNELRVGASGTVFTVIAGTAGTVSVGQSVGIGTSQPGYLLDIRSPVSTGQTALYIQGDVRITGDLNVDDITFDDAIVQDLNVTGISTLATLGVTGGSYFSGITSVGTAITMYPSSGIVSATAFYGNGSNITGLATGLTATVGVSSEGTAIGSGVTQFDFRTNANATLTVDSTVAGVATVTIAPTVSLGLVIALGG